MLYFLYLHVLTNRPEGRPGFSDVSPPVWSLLPTVPEMSGLARDGPASGVISDITLHSCP